MTRFLVLVAVSWLFVLPACSRAPVPVERPFIDMPFDAALAEAKRTQKLVMIDFFTTWCGPCKMLDRVTWKDPQVVEWIGSSCVALKVDAEREVGLATRYRVTGYPTILYVDSSGTEIGRLVGYLDGAGFLGQSRTLIASKARLDKLPVGK
jgi:thiol:disulfide interchange protein